MRIRSIKPEFWRSDDIASLPIEDRLLFLGLWSYVDDNGVGRDTDALIAADLFAHDLGVDARETLARVSRGLARLSEGGLIQRYTVGKRTFLHIVSWARHQKIDKPAKDRYPCPDQGIETTSETLATSSRESRDILAPGAGEQGNRGTGEQDASPDVDAEPAEEKRRIPTRLSKDWMPTASHLSRARERGVTLEYQADRFRAHAETHDRKVANWNRAFTEWLDKADPAREIRPTRARSNGIPETTGRWS